MKNKLFLTSLTLYALFDLLSLLFLLRPLDYASTSGEACTKCAEYQLVALLQLATTI